MNFVSMEFWLLTILTILCCNLCKNKKGKYVIICIASCVFYGWWDVRFLGMVILYSVIVYWTACMVKPGNKGICIAFIIFSLFWLGYFKYYNFFVESVNSIVGLGIKAISIILPLGISFYILTAIGYVLDIYYGKYEAEKSLLKVVVFILYYPKLLSGPIERGNHFFKKLDAVERISKDRIYTGIQIIAFGFLKKLVIADRLGVCVDAVFAHPQIYSAPSLLCAIVSYSIQIYCDFSGYTDIAIGVSYLIGIPLDHNFNLPYCAVNPADFWKRWHISLSSWFRDYIYIPLGGSKRGEVYTCRNLLITMLISGLWHGANWTFVLWGIIHGIAQCLYKLIGRKKTFLPYFMMLINYIFVTVAWTIFRADSLHMAAKIFQGILQWKEGVQYIYVFTPIYFILVMAVSVWTYRKNSGNASYPNLELQRLSHLGIFTVEILLIIALAYFGNSAFIYNRF